MIRGAWALTFTFGFCGCALTPKHLDRAPASAPAVISPSDQEVMAACDRLGWSENVSAAQQKVINEVFGTRTHRLQHALWHAVRSGLPAKTESQVVNAYGGEWQLAHPLCPPPQDNPGTPSYNPVGEDFLYMHHEMVMLLRSSLVAAGLKCIKPWTTIPDPKVWPLPDGDRTGAKSEDAYQRLREWDSFIQSPEWLRKVSLSQLGWALEFTIHNNLHMRYASARPPAGFQAAKADDDGAQVPMDGNYPADWKFDDPKYNWLADPYGAALNPRFWKIHGYVDLAIQRWLEANGKSSVSEACGGGDHACYQWAGLWIGNMPDVTQKVGLPRAAGRPAAHDSAREKDFNHRRLANQRLGVLTDDDFGRKGGPVRAAPPQDLLDVAREKVCP